ncbi:MAG: Rne/Rng family ribonuclease [Rickettsiaceae bacterium]|nr:Rne/Rng family ribonuclease [Rickettsiaceae bacterium]
MSKKILVDASLKDEMRVVVLDQNNLLENFEYRTPDKELIKDNIYLAKVTRIEPSLQAAFIEYGNDKGGFLPFSEISPEYYNIKNSSNVKEALLRLQALPEIESNAIEIVKYDDSKNNIVDNITNEVENILDYNADDLSVEYIIPQEEIANKTRPTPLYKEHKIQDVISRGQVLLVQAQKEERGNKGASFTTYVSLAGQYSVVLPNKGYHSGISKRIVSNSERKRLQGVIKNIVSDNKLLSMILRTASIGKEVYEIQRDYNYLARLWNSIISSAITLSAPSQVYTGEGIAARTVRDFLDHRVKEIVIQGKEAYDKIVNIVEAVLPKEIEKVKLYTENKPIFHQYDIEKNISNLYQPIVGLKSGGYIVINPTEALTAIDVNSGKATSEQNIEETAYRTNIEAVKEVAKQIRLREISGLIVIDLIDMKDDNYKKKVLQKFAYYCSQDKAKIQLGGISNFGLLEMSRQRMKSPFLELHSAMCTQCQGKGVVRNDKANSILILHTIEDEIVSSTNVVNILNVNTNSNVISFLINQKRAEISKLEEQYNVKINFCGKNPPNDSPEAFSIEKIMSKEQAKYQRYNLANKETEKTSTSNKTNSEIFEDEGDVQKQEYFSKQVKFKAIKRRFIKPTQDVRSNPNSSKKDTFEEKPNNFKKNSKNSSTLPDTKNKNPSFLTSIMQKIIG